MTGSSVVKADHGLIETRTATLSAEIDCLQKQHQWLGLKAIGKVERVRQTAEKTTTEIAYYLLSKCCMNRGENFQSLCFERSITPERK